MIYYNCVVFIYFIFCKVWQMYYVQVKRNVYYKKSMFFLTKNDYFETMNR